jgi:hypothetical protein
MNKYKMMNINNNINLQHKIIKDQEIIRFFINSLLIE